MTKKTSVCFGALLVGLVSVSNGYGRTGQLGLSYTLGPSFIVGGSGARDVATVEPGVGAMLQLGLSRSFDATFAYDYIDADLRTQALTFGGQWRLAPDARHCPFLGAGLGFGKPFSGEDWGHVSLKLSGGVEKTLTSNVALAGILSYQYVQGPDPIGSVHSLEPGVRLIYYFGNLRR